MNHDDYKPAPYDDRDLLMMMFEMQMSLQRRIRGDAWQPWDGTYPINEEAAAAITKHVGEEMTCITQEAAECRDWTPWKHWSQRLGNKVDVEMWSPEHIKELQVEIVDLWHFLINASAAVGMGPHDVFGLYLEKNRVNFERQDKGGY